MYRTIIGFGLLDSMKNKLSWWKAVYKESQKIMQPLNTILSCFFRFRSTNRINKIMRKPDFMGNVIH